MIEINNVEIGDTIEEWGFGDTKVLDINRSKNLIKVLFGDGSIGWHPISHFGNAKIKEKNNKCNPTRQLEFKVGLEIDEAEDKIDRLIKKMKKAKEMQAEIVEENKKKLILTSELLFESELLPGDKFKTPIGKEYIVIEGHCLKNSLKNRGLIPCVQVETGIVGMVVPEVCVEKINKGVN